MGVYFYPLTTPQLLRSTIESNQLLANSLFAINAFNFSKNAGRVQESVFRCVSDDVAHPDGPPVQLALASS